MGLYLDYEYVTLVAKATGSDITGTVDSSERKMEFKAEKVLKSEKK